MSQFYPLQITAITKETPKAVSIAFEIPSNLKDQFQFVAGQYITLKTTINGNEVRRAYSLCSSPVSNQIVVAIKAIENGVFSTYATTILKVGDILEVTQPEGKFMLTPQLNKNYIAFAAGSGITPIFSMIKSVLATTPNSTFTLIYGNKTINDAIFYNELNALQQAHPNQFKLHYVFSKADVEQSLFGRIDKGNTNYFVKNIYKDIVFDAAFLCGPEQMIDTVKTTLLENEFSKDTIHFELFTASTNSEVTSQIQEGKTAATIVLDDEEISFTMDQNDTILAAALRNKLDAPYSCQGGVCSSCLAKVTKGKAIMTANQILTDSELEQGFILTCKAHPTTATIVVDYDDI